MVMIVVSWFGDLWARVPWTIQPMSITSKMFIPP